MASRPQDVLWQKQTDAADFTSEPELSQGIVKHRLACTLSHGESEVTAGQRASDCIYVDDLLLFNKDGASLI